MRNLSPVLRLAVIALVAAGIIGGSAYLFSHKTAPALPASAVATYTNTDYGFSIQYPVNLTIATGTRASGSPTHQKVVSFTDRRMTSSQYSIRGVLAIEYVDAACSVEYLGSAFTSSTTKDNGMVTLGNTSFHAYAAEVDAVGDSTPGYLLSQGYTAPWRNGCLLIDTVIEGAGKNSANPDSSQIGAVAELHRELDPMPSTFRAI